MSDAPHKRRGSLIDVHDPTESSLGYGGSRDYNNLGSVSNFAHGDTFFIRDANAKVPQPTDVPVAGEEPEQETAQSLPSRTAKLDVNSHHHHHHHKHKRAGEKSSS